MRSNLAILGIPIDAVDTAEALDRLEGFVHAGGFHQVATANTDFLVRADTDPELRTVLRAADLVVADGMPVVKAARWLGYPLPERVAGADLVPLLARRAAERGYRVYLLGARQEVAARARQVLEAANPGLTIVGQVSPPLAPVAAMDHEAILADIEAAEPHVLLVAFGNPKQEKWIHMHRSRLQVPVCMGIGGTLDFIAGATRRAPLWMQRTGLEWFHRLAHEPRRLWRRYSTDAAVFGRGIVAQRRALPSAHAAPPAAVHVDGRQAVSVVRVEGALNGAAHAALADAACTCLRRPADVVLDCSAVTTVDSAGIAALLAVARCAALDGRTARLAAPPEPVARALRHARVFEAMPVYDTANAAAAAVGDAPVSVRTRARAAGIDIVIEGCADLRSVAAIEEAAAGACPEAASLHIDLRGVTYLDSAALTAVHRLSARSPRTSVSANKIALAAIGVGGMADRMPTAPAPDRASGAPGQSDAVEV